MPKPEKCASHSRGDNCNTHPTVKRRMLGYLSAAAISLVMLFIPAIDRGVYCMLLCPPQLHRIIHTRAKYQNCCATAADSEST